MNLSDHITSLAEWMIEHENSFVNSVIKFSSRFDSLIKAQNSNSDGLDSQNNPLSHFCKWLENKHNYFSAIALCNMHHSKMIASLFADSNLGYHLTKNDDEFHLMFSKNFILNSRSSDLHKTSEYQHWLNLLQIASINRQGLQVLSDKNFTLREGGPVFTSDQLNQPIQPFDYATECFFDERNISRVSF